MPYQSISAAKEAGFPTHKDDIPLSLSQINKFASIYDAIKAQGSADNPMAVAWTQWKKLYKKDGNKWVKKEKKSISESIKEVRCWDIKGLTLRIAQDKEGNNKKIVGYAAIFDSLSEDLGGFREKIRPGAFKKAIKRSDVRALFNHDSNFVLGRQGAGTLTLKEDDKGLWMEIDPPDTQFAQDLMVSIERGDINQQSFGFTVLRDTWDGLNTGNTTRTLEEIDQLYDVSPVTFPAYQDTSVALRSMEKAQENESDQQNEIDNSQSDVTFENRVIKLLAEIRDSIKTNRDATISESTDEGEPTQNRKSKNNSIADVYREYLNKDVKK